MTTRIVRWTLDVADVDRMAEFWSRALGYRIDPEDDGAVHLEGPGAGHLSVYLQAGAGHKKGKNRNHPDLASVDGDVESEVQRLLALGATRADVGQDGTEAFEVLADPEGNEFCLLHRAPRTA